MAVLNTIEDAFLLIKDGLIADFGPMTTNKYNDLLNQSDVIAINVKGKMVMPCYCDSHTHLVYAASREGEFVDRINGLTYEEIALRGGGILNSSKHLANVSEDELYESASLRLKEIALSGTGAVEIKSGYGLSLESELKMLRVIKRLKQDSKLTIKATFLGAHAVLTEYKQDKSGYIKLITDNMMPKIAEENLADYCDVFCENNYFTKAETIHILECGKKNGMIPKVHAEQLSHTGGIEAGVECGAISVDHLEYANETDLELLKYSKTAATILPGAAYFLGLPSPPARKLIDAGAIVAIASDYNPGSSPSGNMNTMMSIACIQYRLNPEEVFNASTLNGAYAMGVEKELGCITKGKKANVFITKEIPSYAYLPYSFGSNLVETVILNGEIIAY